MVEALTEGHPDDERVGEGVSVLESVALAVEDTVTEYVALPNDDALLLMQAEVDAETEGGAVKEP